MLKTNRDLSLVEKILQLKRDRNAVILAHNYVRPEVQRMADFVGDSLELARKVLDEDVCQGAKKALERMFELSTPER